MVRGTRSVQKSKEWYNRFLSVCRYNQVDGIHDLYPIEQAIKEGSNWHQDGSFGFRLACERGSRDVLEWMLSDSVFTRTWGRVDIHAENEQGFRAACRNGDIELVKRLTSRKVEEDGYGRVNIHACNQEGIRSAIQRGHLPVIQWLLGENLMERWMDVSVEDFKQQWISEAYSSNRIEILEYLVKSMKDQSNPKVIQQLVKWGKENVHVQSFLESILWSKEFSEFNQSRVLIRRL